MCVSPFRFPFVNLAHLTSRFLIAFFPPNVALNPPSSSPPPRPRRHILVAGIAVSTSGQSFPSSSKHHLRSIIICPKRMTGPSYSPSTSSTCPTPATHSATATPTQVTLTSTTANAATIIDPPAVAHRCCEPRPLYSHLETDTLCSLDVYRLPEVWG